MPVMEWAALDSYQNVDLIKIYGNNAFQNRSRKHICELYLALSKQIMLMS